jgi:hypothetical protein
MDVMKRKLNCSALGIIAVIWISSATASLPELPLNSMQFKVRNGGMDRVIGLLKKFAKQAGYECASDRSGITCGMAGDGNLMYSHLSAANELTLVTVYNQYDENGRAKPEVAKDASSVVQQMMSAVHKERSIVKACALPENFGVSFSCK